MCQAGADKCKYILLYIRVLIIVRLMTTVRGDMLIAAVKCGDRHAILAAVLGDRWILKVALVQFFIELTLAVRLLLCYRLWCSTCFAGSSASRRCVVALPVA